MHQTELATQSAHSYHVVSLQTFATSAYGLDIKVISTIHASILQTLRHSPAPADEFRTVRPAFGHPLAVPGWPCQVGGKKKAPR
jgi:hypothetical protein